MGPCLDRLIERKHSSAKGDQVWWQQGPTSATIFYGAGRAGDVETTALASMALLAAGREPALVRGSLAWLAAQKDACGTWYSTQATVLALKAILAGTGRPLANAQARRIEIALDGKRIQELLIPAEQSDVVQLVRLSSQLGTGSHRLHLTDQTGSASLYQVTFSYHTPTGEQPERRAFQLALDYDRKECKVGETVTTTVRLVNRQAMPAPMVMLQLPVPPGFTPEPDDLALFVKDKGVAKVQQSPGKVLLYLYGLESGESLGLSYRLRAGLSGKVTAAPAVAWEYYNPEHEARSQGVLLSVNEGK